jgi:hypothetical protein
MRLPNFEKLEKLRGAYAFQEDRKWRLYVPCLEQSYKFSFKQKGYVILREVYDTWISRGKMGQIGLHRLIVHRLHGQPDRTKCEICGYSLPWTYWKNEFSDVPGAVVINVDHIDENPYNNEPENLRPLCRWCNWNRVYAEVDHDIFYGMMYAAKNTHPALRNNIPKMLRDRGLYNPIPDRK